MMMKTVVLVGAAVIHEGRILLLKRLETKRFLPGYYDVPGGKLEEGEEPNTAVLRELKEETGLVGRIIRPYNVWHSILDIGGDKEHIIEVDYLVEVKDTNGIVLSRTEFSEYIWADRHSIPEKITPELKGTILKAFEAG
jgi:8-oxo-dGTP diphosphatase